jgi:hypothetical protein
MSERGSGLPSLRSVLFSADDAPAVLRRSLREQGTLGKVTHALAGLPEDSRDAASGGLGEVVAELLDVDLIDVLKLGWQKTVLLRDAAVRTLENPGSQEIVDLATHRITSTHEPRVDVLIDEVPVFTIHLRIELRIVLRAIRGVVEAGRLVALTSGTADITAELFCEGESIRSVSSELDLHLELRLGDGLRLEEPLPLELPPVPGPPPHH